MVKSRFDIISPDELVKVIKWYKEGRGATLWTSLEIGANRPDLLMPGDVETKPHWAYAADDKPVQPEEIATQARTWYEQPDEWFPACERCKGEGKRSYAELVEIRGGTETVEEVKAICSFSKNGIDDEHFECNFCCGSGRARKPLVIRVKRTWWGGIEPVGGTRYGDPALNEPPKSVEKMLKKLEQYHELEPGSLKWDFDCTGYGLANVEFYTSKDSTVAEVMATGEYGSVKLNAE